MVALITFYKEAEKWYADIPNISKEDCEMILGADTLLDDLSLGYNNVEITFSDTNNNITPIYEYELIEHDECGGTYSNNKQTFWLCNVTHNIFSEHPNKIYITKIKPF